MHKTLYNISRGGQVPPLGHAYGIPWCVLCRHW